MTIKTSSKFGQSLKALRQEKGLTQETLAATLGSSSRYISFIETERSHPSRTYLINLAEALDLPPMFRDHILINAGYAPVTVAHQFTRSDQEGLLNNLRWQADNFSPYPAITVNRCWDIQYANKAVYHFLRAFDIDTSRIDSSDANHLDVMLSPDACRPHIYNLFETEVFYLGRLKAASIRYPEDERYVQLLARAISYSDTWSARNINLLNCNQQLLNYIHFRSGDIDFRVQTIRGTMAGPLDASIDEFWMEASCPADARADEEYRKFVNW